MTNMTSRNLTKLLCVALFVGVVITILAGNAPILRRVHAYAEGPPAGVTGAPGETTCATSGCHTGTPNTGSGQFKIDAPSVYQPGAKYQITVTHSATDGSRRRWGFQLTVLTADNSKAGDMQRPNDLLQLLNDDGPGFNRQYIEHTITGTFPGTRGSGSWTFDWVAPSSDVGPVTFYAAGNQGNNDGTNSGDQIYTATTVSNPAGPVLQPEIISVSAGKKHLFVMGKNFDAGAAILLNGTPANTESDETTPTELLLGLKVIKKGKIQPGQEVNVQVQNNSGLVSVGFPYRRPEN